MLTEKEKINKQRNLFMIDTILLEKWWVRENSNLRPMDYEGSDRLIFFRAVDLSR